MSRRGVLGAALLGAASGLLPASALAAGAAPGVPQQAMFLHDHHRTGLSPFPAPRAGRLLWAVPLGSRLIATPAIDASGNTWWATTAGRLVGLDVDGRALLDLELGDATYSSPAIDRRGNLYAATLGGRVLSVGPDGHLRWSVDMALELRSSPMLDEAGGRLVFSAFDQTIALSMRDGRRLFSFVTGNDRLNSSPSLGPDGLIRVANWGGIVMAISGAGRLVWSTTVALGMGNSFWTAPTLGSFGTLYTAGSSRELMALTPGGRILWSAGLGDVPSGFLSLLPNGHILTPTARAVLAARPDGRPAWSYDLGDDLLSVSLAVSAEGSVLFGTGAGRIMALDLHGQPVWRSPPQGFAPLSCSAVIAAPVRNAPRCYLGDSEGNALCVV